MPRGRKARKSVAGRGIGIGRQPLGTFDDGLSGDDASKLPSHPSSNVPSSSPDPPMVLVLRRSSRLSADSFSVATSSSSFLGEPSVATSLKDHPLSFSSDCSKTVIPDKPVRRSKRTNAVDRIFDAELHEKIQKRNAEKEAEEKAEKAEKKAKKAEKKAGKMEEKKKLLQDAVAVETELPTQTENRIETEAEILSRLPPLTPALLAETKDVEFYMDLDREDVALTFDDVDCSYDSCNEKGTKEKVKYHWGDTDSEDELEAAAVDKTREDKAENVGQKPETRSGIPSFGDIRVAPRVVEDAEVDRLHGEHLPNLNGNEDKNGNFKEWHETLTVNSYKEGVLHIKPYTVIDF